MGQVIEITLQNLRSIPQRLGASIVLIVGVAGVVAVLVAVLSIARGFERTLSVVGSTDNVVILRSGSSSELNSGLSGEQVDVIQQAPGFLQYEGQPLVSPELYTMVDLNKKSTGTTANVPFRGVGSNAMVVRDGFELLEGRLFVPGRKELIVGRGAQSQFENLVVGTTLALGQERWDVVGSFSGQGGSIESELWADAAVVQSAFRRGNNYASIYARLASSEALTELKDTLTSDPRLSLAIERESDFFAEQSGTLSGFISGIGYTIAILMALGAIFGALNSMYSAVSDRTREIATLRAIGFSQFAIVLSVLAEAMLLALIGGVLGAGIAYLLFNGFTVSTLNFSSFTQVVFDFAITGDLLLQGVLLALLIGLLGGITPALRAARMPIATALRS